MARVLCAWEFGGDLGHIRRLIPIARELRAMGHDVVFALRDSSFLETARAQGFETFIAPLLRAPRTVNPSPVSFPDILSNLGFDDRLGLAGALRAWRSFYDLVAPDVLVADYAPTALIAARAARLARVTTGSGFSSPPLGDPMPGLRSWLKADPNVLRALDERLVQSVRAALGAGEGAPRHAREIFEAHAHLVCTFSGLDPFGPREDVEYVGPQADAAEGADVRWREEGGTRVFAYLKPRGSPFSAALAGLAALDAEVVVAAPGLTPQAAHAQSTARMRVLGTAVALDAILPGASLCVGHAGPGLGARALIAGVPMALLPLQLEQFLVARRMTAGGSAAMISPEEPAPDFRAWFASILGNDALREAAAQHARAHRAHCFVEATRQAARRIATVAGA